MHFVGIFFFGIRLEIARNLEKIQSAIIATETPPIADHAFKIDPDI
jgi:hypothetical protein